MSKLISKSKSTTEREQLVKRAFQQITSNDTRLIEHFSDDVATTVADASSIFDQMIPEMAYVDNPDNAMANSLFFCTALLAIYLALKPQGVNVHEYGRLMLEILAANTDARNAASEARKKPAPELVDAAGQSQSNPQPGEFVFEVYEGESNDVDWGMNIKSCAICSQFSRYDAMDLVPYMCATDDVISDLGAQGLRRTGSIAVGAHHCDFVYKHQGKPQHLSNQYPEKIRIVE